MEVRRVNESCKIDAQNRDYSLQREKEERCCPGRVT